MEEKGERIERLGFQLKAVNNLIRRKLDVTFSEMGLGDLSGMQGPMIGYIVDNSAKQDIFQKDIEKVFHIRRSTATVMLQNLELKGYIQREAVKEDARLKKITVTDKARQYHQHIIEVIGQFNDNLEKGLTDKEKQEFTRILGKMMDNLNNEP